MTDLHEPLADPLLRRRLKRTAWIVHGLIAVGAAVLVGHEAWTWASPERALREVNDITDVTCIDRVTLQAQVLGALLTLLPVGVTLLALSRLWQLFAEYGRGRVFTRAALGSLRGFARCTLASGIVSPLYGVALSVVFTWVNKPGHREISLNISSGDYGMLLTGAVLLAISSVMAEAARVVEDNAGFV